jgi:hypothetical protein
MPTYIYIFIITCKRIIVLRKVIKFTIYLQAASVLTNCHVCRLVTLQRHYYLFLYNMVFNNEPYCTHSHLSLCHLFLPPYHSPTSLSEPPATYLVSSSLSSCFPSSELERCASLKLQCIYYRR